jgi:hypothetical protein
MHRVEAFGLGTRQMRHARGHHAQPGALEAREDLADHVLRHCVRLDDGQGALDRHSRILRGLPEKSARDSSMGRRRFS